MRQQKKTRSKRKPQFVVDHNTSLHGLIKEYGKFANFISSAKLTGSQSTLDPDIIRAANHQDFHIITLNTRDFKNAPIQHLDLKIGIICVNLQEKLYREQFGKILRGKRFHRNYYNKLIILGNPVKTYSYTSLRKSD